MNDRSTKRRLALVALVLATVLALAWTLWPDPSPPAAAPPPPPEPQAALAVVPGTVLKPPVCGTLPVRKFVPQRISIPKVIKNAEVLALQRDAAGVPQAPPLSTAGKTQFAWDEPTLKPGSRRGNVLINTHTYPDGSALGNRLLERLKVGGRIIVKGAGGVELCYEVTKRDVIRAADGSFEYYEKKGPPQIALIVCSPPRLGPGNWVNRTIWYASPIMPDAA